MARRWQVTAGFGAAVIALGLLAGSAAAAGNTVTIASFAFAPGTITVTPGTTVTWTNNDGVGHTATGTGFDTGTIAAGTSASFTFATAGSFAYHCAIHPSMTGTVVVQDAAQATPTPTPHGDGTTGRPKPTTPSTDGIATGSVRPVSGGDMTPFALLVAAGAVGLALGLAVVGRPSRELARRRVRTTHDDPRDQPKR